MNIFIPSRRLITPKQELCIPHKMAGWFKLEAVRADGSRRLLADWFPNLIVNAGLDAIGNNATWLSQCFVGSGNNAPANTDTSLQTLVASTSSINVNTQGNSGSSPWFGTTTNTYRFAIGVATGNLAEVGVGTDATHIFSRALILDGGGSPTTITVLSSEALDVTYQLQNNSPTADVTGSITIAAVSYAYTVRAANANGTTQWAVGSHGDQGGLGGITPTVFNGAIGAVTGQPSGTSATGAGANSAYSNGNHFTDALISFSLVQGNVSGGVAALLFSLGQGGSSLGEMQIGFVPSIPKDGSHTMTLGVRHTWARFP